MQDLSPTTGQATGARQEDDGRQGTGGRRKGRASRVAARVKEIFTKPKQKLDTLTATAGNADYVPANVGAAVVTGELQYSATRPQDMTLADNVAAGAATDDFFDTGADATAAAQAGRSALNAQGELNRMEREGQASGIGWREQRRTRNSSGVAAGTSGPGAAADAMTFIRHALGSVEKAVPPGIGEASFGLLTAIAATRLVQDVRHFVRTARRRGNVADIRMPADSFDDTAAGSDLQRRIRETREELERNRTNREALIDASRAGEQGASGQRSAGADLERIEREIEEQAQIRRLQIAAAGLLREIGELEDQLRAGTEAHAEGAADRAKLGEIHGYALKKQKRRLKKKGISALGNGAKVAGSAVFVAMFAGAVAFTSPAGWILGAAAALLAGGLGAYKMIKSIQKRYKTLREEKNAEGVPIKTPREAFLHALAFWKSAGTGKRTRMAGELRRLAAGTGVDEEVRDTARQLLRELNLGAGSLRQSEAEWETSLASDDENEQQRWDRMIANRLAS